MQLDNVLHKPLARRGPRVAWRDFQCVLGGAIGLALLFSLDLQAGLWGLLRIALGLIYVLYVPGYCLVGALFPDPADLDRPARMGAAIGLSVALVPALALLLDRLPWGIHPWPILGAECGGIGLCTAIALGRRVRCPADPPREAGEAPGRASLSPRAWWRAQTRASRGLLAVLGALLVGLALAGAGLAGQPAAAASTTEFYILGAGGQMQDYPRAAGATGALTVTMGLVNRERNTQHYRVEVWAQDSPTAGDRTLVAQAGPFVLAAGAQVEGPLTWPLAGRGAAAAVEFLLFTENNPQPYRQLRLELDSVPPAPAGASEK